MRSFSFFIFLASIFFSFDLGHQNRAIANPNASFNNLLGKKRVSGSITTSIASENDDVEIWRWDTWFDGETGFGKIWLGSWGGDPVWAALRFQLPTAIPSGATITSASLSAFGDGRDSWNDSLDYLEIFVNDSSNAPQVVNSDDQPGGANGLNFSSAPGNVVSGIDVKVRCPVGAGGLAWNDSLLNTCSGLETLIQFLVNKYGGLAAGAYVQIWMYNPRLTDAEIIMADYGHASPAPMLLINWTK